MLFLTKVTTYEAHSTTTRDTGFKTATMKHLILVGACYLDTILSVPFFPTEDSKLRATTLNIRRGGNCPNSIQVLEQLFTEQDAVQPYLVSCLPNASSPASRRIAASFGPSSKLDLRHCIYHEAKSEAASSYIIRSLETGSRTLVNYNDLPEMTMEQFETITRRFSPDQETWWHFEVSPAENEAASTGRQWCRADTA